MTVSIANLTSQWTNASINYTGLGLNVNASAYGSLSDVVKIRFNNNEVFRFRVGNSVSQIIINTNEIYSETSYQTTNTSNFWVGSQDLPNDLQHYIWGQLNIPITFYTNNTERMRITGNGKVGINTSTPTTLGIEAWGRLTYTSEYEETSFKLVAPAHDYPMFHLVAFGGTQTYENGEFLCRRMRGSPDAPAATQDGDIIGNFIFRAENPTGDRGFSDLAHIKAEQVGSAGNGIPGNLIFSVNDGNNSFPSERMRITHDGRVLINTVDPNSRFGVEGNNPFTITGRNETLTAGLFFSGSSSYNSDVILAGALRAASSDFSFLTAISGIFGGSPDTEFRLRGDGEAFADGSWTGGGADYAEYFEWSDGNPDEEDRRGYSVVLAGEKVRPATSDDDPSAIIGVVSTTPAVVGDAAWNHWTGKYLRDEYGSHIMEDYEVWEWTEVITKPPIRPDAEETTEDKLHSYAFDGVPEGVIVPDDKTITIQQRKKLNPDYDSNTEYVSRENRPEWTTIGLMGKLRLRKGQPTGDRWIKMRGISADVEEWLVR